MRLCVRAASVAVLVIGIVCPAAQADIIIQFTFPTADGAGNETGPGLDPTTVHPNLNTSVLMAIRDTSNKVTLGTENPTPNYATEPVLRVNPNGNAASATAAVTNGVFFSFTLEPDTGYVMNLDSLQFKASRGGASTPRGWVVRSSLDGYATNIDSADIPTQRPTWTDYSLNLSGSLYQNISGPVTFRFYVYSPAAGSTIEFDNITLNGTVVPEPSAWALAASGLLLVLACRRRRGAD